MRKWYDDLVYPEELLDEIKENINLLGIIDSYFKIHGATYCDWTIFREDEQIIKKDYSLRICPNNKFCYDCCCFHMNYPYHYSFYVLENVKLYKCMGCGASGDAFNFTMEKYNLNINQATEVLAAILNVFDLEKLDQTSRKVYDELMLYYGKQDEYFKISENKTKYLSDRVERYLNNMKDLSKIDFKKIANRLCCSEDFVKEKYHETDYYRESNNKQLVKKIETNNLFE